LLAATSSGFSSLRTLAGVNLHPNLIYPQHAITVSEYEGLIKELVREATAKPESLRVKLQMKTIRPDFDTFPFPR
jgi:hypothetical protein